jgi:signal transduction histidine kinase
MQPLEVLAIAAAVMTGMLCALFFLVWRAAKVRWAPYWALAFFLICLSYAFDSKMLPVNGKPNIYATVIWHSALLFIVLGLSQLVPLPGRAMRGIKMLVAVNWALTITLVGLGLVSRTYAFGAIAVSSFAVAGQAILMVRASPDPSIWLVLAATLVSPLGFVATLLQLVPLDWLRYSGSVSTTLLGMSILTSGLLRLHGRSEQAEQGLRALNESLEQRVVDRTTELRDALARVDQVNTELRELNASRTRLLAAACHDLRQPSHALGMLAEIAAENADLAVRPQIDGIRRSSSALSDMLDRLLDMTQLESDRYAPSASAFPIDELLAELRVQFGPVAQKKGLTFTVDASAAHVRTDRHLLRRVLINLVSNAIKYTSTGSVRVLAEPEDERLVLRIVDTGPGIPAAEQESIYTDYVRLDNSTRTEGLGIGLAIVRRAADLLGIDLSLRSIEGQGSTFSLALALAPTPAPSQQAVVPTQGQGKLVALLENDEEILLATSQLLRSFGFLVAVGTTVETLQQAIAAQGRTAPDALISDLHIGPQLNGLSVIEALSRDPAWARVAFLLVTGDLDPAVTARAASMSVTVAYKPVPPRRLLALLEQGLQAEVA